MDPASILILKHRLQAVVLKRNLLDKFSKMFQPTARLAPSDPERQAVEAKDDDQEIDENTKAQPLLEQQLDEPQSPVETEPEEVSGATPTDDPPFEPEPVQEMSPEEEQTCCEETYIRFGGTEEVDDYTAGPARFIPGFDGVKDCATLLMTYDFSQKIQKAVTRQTLYAREERRGAEQLEKIEECEQEVRDEILNHEIRISTAQRKQREETLDAEQEAQIESWGYARDILQQIADRMDGKKHMVRQMLDWEAKMLREAHAEVCAHLDEAFVQTCLIEPEESAEDEPAQGFDLRNKYQQFIQDREEEANLTSSRVTFPPAPELDTTPATLKREVKPPSEEELARQKILQTVCDAQDRVERAQRYFDNRVQEQDWDQEMNYRAELAGEPTGYASREEFDLHWVTVNQEFTHELLEAEEAYSQAKAAAVEAGVKFQDDNQSSCFGDDFDCAGYPMSQEIDVGDVTAWVTPKIDRWLQHVPEDADSDYEGSVDVDEWDFKELDFSDSLSCVDYGKRRKRIDRWQRDCQAAGKGVACDQ